VSPPRRLRWGGVQEPPPKHPYRDTFLVYGVLAVIVVLVAWATGGGVWKALAVAAAFFVLATGWNTYRLRQRAARESDAKSSSQAGRP
jgi:membrane protein implicated in regulation of membrane protease activity